MKTHISPYRVILAGLLLAGLPCLFIVQHWHMAVRDIRFETVSELSTFANIDNVNIKSHLNQLNLSELSGSDNIDVNDTVYVHMATGPDLIAYPFAITLHRPVFRNDNRAFSIRGLVTDREDNQLQIRYNFETFLPPQDLKENVEDYLFETVRVELAVNKKAVARLVAIHVDDVSYPYRVMEKPVLKGFTR